MNHLERILTECSVAYAKCKMVLESGLATDYIFLDMNEAFSNLIRTTKKALIGRSASNVFKSDLEQTKRWIDSYKTIYDTGFVEFIQYSPQFKQSYFVKAYLIESNTFITIVEPYDPYKIAFQKLKKDHDLILNSIAEGVIVVSKNYEIHSINQRALELLGYDNNVSIIGVSAFEFLFNENKDSIREKFESLVKKPPLYNVQTKFVTKSKQKISVTASINNRIIDTSDLGYVITFSDISNQKALEAELEQAEHTKSIMLNHLPGMIYSCLYDENYTMIFASEGAQALTGYDADDFIGNKNISFNDIIHPEYIEDLFREWDVVIKEKRDFEREYMIITKSGQNKWVYEKGRPIYNQQGEVVSLEGIIIDLNKRRERDLEIEHLMYHDQLTGLRNRLYFDEMLEKYEHEKRYPLGIMVADVDSTKFINDTLGRHIGDKVLSDIAYILRKYEKDDIVVARTGGDEFSLILPNSDALKTYDIMISIQDEVKAYQYDNHGVSYHLSISMGFETKLDDQISMKEVIRDAEDFMQRRKLIARSQSNRDSLSSIKATMLANSQETQEHMDRMAEIALKVGSKLGLRQQAMDDLYLLAMLHDIGKIGIPTNILNKPGKLTDEEWDIMKTHPLIGYQIAMSSKDIKNIAKGILSHHERFDGLGYPNKIKGRDIPLISRIISIIDAYDAITQDRPYRQKRSHEDAIKEIIACSNTQFDPEIVEVFLTIFD